MTVRQPARAAVAAFASSADLGGASGCAGRAHSARAARTTAAARINLSDKRPSTRDARRLMIAALDLRN